jgi:hypothetical protein
MKSEDRRYPVQFAFVGTVTQKRHLAEEARKRRTSLADAVRRAVDDKYGLVEGEEPSAEED